MVIGTPMRRSIATLVVAALVLVFVLTLEASPAAGASRKACRVKNASTGQTYTRLQQAVDAAESGQALIVKGTCVGATEFRKDLVIKGVKTRRWGKPILDGARKTRLLYVRRVATVTVMNLTIQHGRANLAYGHGVGGGIANFGTLTLRNVIVRDNFAANDGSGIYNQGVLTLAGRTSIRDNRGITGITSVGYSWWSGLSTAAEGRSPSITMDDASSVSGHKHSGVFVEGGTLTMNDSSSIFGNKATAGGGVNVYYGRLVMNDASSIHDNRANETGGGVFGGTLTMNDASSIHDNRAVAADGTLGQGGGVWIYSGTNPVGVTCGPDGNVHGNMPDDCYFE